MRHGRVVVAALALILALAGCATSGTPGSGSPDPTQTAEPGMTRPLLPLTVRSILAYCPDVAAVHFDGNTDAVEEIYVCTAEDILSTDGSTSDTVPSLERASRVVDGGDELLAAYSEPNALRTTGACIELAADPLIVWLKTAERIIPVYAPVDECGFPTDAATEAHRVIGLDTIEEVRLDSPPEEQKDD